MASTTRWVIDTAFTQLNTGSELTSLASGSAGLCSTTIANGSNLDMFMDVSLKFTIGSATPIAGAVIALYIAPLNQDGTNYGTGEIASLGGTLARPPAQAPDASVWIESSAATTLMMGMARGLIIPPGTFGLLVYNGTGVAFSATPANNLVYVRTYNINLNV